jgi:hypothetical protein
MTASNVPEREALAAPLPSRWLVALLFFILPAIAYAAIVTRFGFDLFAPNYGWQAFNYLALALSEGHQWVPAEAIAAEGMYIGGRVYMYYGLLPSILRLPLMPFIDLRTTPVSNLLMLLMMLTGQAALQLAILRIFVANGRTGVFADRAMLVLVSFATWFSSGAFITILNGNFYHETYAAALMLVSVFTAMLVRDLLIEDRRPGGLRLLGYATLAGLAVFTRQTCAVGLYIAVLALLLPRWADLRAQPRAVIVATLRRSILPLAILFVAGVLYLAGNYLRTGATGTAWSVHDYGYYILDMNRPRLETIINQQFSVVRIGPNILYLLVGGAELRDSLILKLGGGIVETHGGSIKWLVFAALPLMFAAAGAVCVWRRVRRDDLLAPMLWVTLGFATSAALLLAYATMTYRYAGDVWPLICWLMLVAYRDIDPSRLFGRRAKPALGVMAALSLVSVGYSARLDDRVIDDAPYDHSSLRIGMPLAPELAALATAPGSRDPDIERLRIAAGPDPFLPPNYRAPSGNPTP